MTREIKSKSELKKKLLHLFNLGVLRRESNICFIGYYLLLKEWKDPCLEKGSRGLLKCVKNGEYIMRLWKKKWRNIIMWGKMHKQRKKNSKL